MNKSHIKKLLSLQNDITLYLNTEIALALTDGQSSNQQVIDHINLLLEQALGREALPHMKGSD